MGASVTLWEATAPVKLPIWPGLRARSWSRMRHKTLREWYFTFASPTPTRIGSQAPTYATTYCLVSRPNYSKAPRGLFVLSRVTRIFTGTSISPSPLSRQCSSRYSFRAGRNLPDKEFRYLRTVIVTAAVHRGLDSQLRSPLLVTFRHWAGVSPYTSASRSQRPVFLVNSRLSQFLAAPSPPCLRRVATRAPLLPKVRGQFAEFLNRGSLDHLGGVPPAYLCRFAVRAEQTLARGFSWRPRGR